MQKIKISLFLCVLACGLSELKAQDLLYSQFYNAPLLLNPALTGMGERPRVGLQYRNQWPGLPQAYTSYSAYYDQSFEKAKSGIGLQILNDVQGNGILTTTGASAFYSYNLQVSKKLFLKAGVEAGYYNYRLDWDRLTFLDQIDPRLGITRPTGEPRPGTLSGGFLDLGMGVIAYTSKFYGGLSVKHINSPERKLLRGQSSAGVPVRFVAHAGGEINLNPNNKIGKTPFISPNILFARQGEFQQLNAGAYVGYGNLFGGAWFRMGFNNPDAAISMVGFRKGIYKVAYSFDYTLSKLGIEQGGAHEISFTLNFSDDEKYQKNRFARRYSDCLKMFQ